MICASCARFASSQNTAGVLLRRARVTASFDDLFDSRAWIQVMIGQNLIPETYHPIADLLPEERLKEFLDGLEKSHVTEVSQWPDHGAFVARFAPVSRELVPA